jgi:hypothetical protein
MHANSIESISSGRLAEVEGSRLVRGFRVLIVRQIVRSVGILFRCGFVELAMFLCGFREPGCMLSCEFCIFLA